MSAALAKRVLGWVAVPLLLYGALALFACAGADRLIFYPPRPGYTADSESLLRFDTQEGETITAFHFPAPSGRPTLLYSHGNAEDIGNSLPLYRDFEAAGLGVFAYDYPGYGHATGRPTEASCERAIMAAWKHLTEVLGVPASDVVIVGRSVGSGPSVWLDSQVEPLALVLIAPFTSTFAVRPPADKILPGNRFTNEQRIRRSTTPLLVIHGDADRVIPFAHGRAVFEAGAAEKKEFLELPGVGHNDIFAREADLIVSTIAKFAKH